MKPTTRFRRVSSLPVCVVFSRRAKIGWRAAALVAVIAMTTVGVHAPRIYDSVEVAAGHNLYRFSDVTGQVGIPVAPTLSWGTTFIDYDDNGWPDALIGRHVRPPWFLTNAGGTFTRRA